MLPEPHTVGSKTHDFTDVNDVAVGGAIYRHINSHSSLQEAFEAPIF